MGLFSFFKKKKKEIEKVEAVSVKEAPKAEVKSEPAPELAHEPEKVEKSVATKAPVAQKASEAEGGVKAGTPDVSHEQPEKPKKAAPKKPKAEPKPADEAVLENVSEKPKSAAKSAAKNEAAKAEPKVEPKAEEADEATAPTSEKITGRFEIKKAKDGRFVFNLYAANHVIVATSQVYSSSTSAVNGIQSVINNADKAPIEDQSLKSYETYGYPKWEIYVDKGGQYRFRLYAANGSCICHSQGYTSKTNCKNGIDSIIRSSRNAEIDKSYLKKEDK